MQGQLCALDVGEASVLHEDLLMDGLQACPSLLHDRGTQALLGCCIYIFMTHRCICNLPFLLASARRQHYSVCGSHHNSKD